MKKSKTVSLVLMTTLLAACSKDENEWSDGQSNTGGKVYMRSDSTAAYARTHHHSGMASGLMYYYLFRSVGGFSNGAYNRAGYYSGGLGTRANVGRNSFKGSVVRNGFGSRAFSSARS